MADGRWVMTNEELDGGFGYQSFKCKECGGTTDFVYQDDVNHFSFV